MTAPNLEPVPNTATVEHLGATYLLDHPVFIKTIYFGPMGCRTGSHHPPGDQ